MAAEGWPKRTAGIESSVLLTPVMEASMTRPIAAWSPLKNSTMNGMERAMTMTPDAPGTMPVKPATKTATTTAIQ